MVRRFVLQDFDIQLKLDTQQFCVLMTGHKTYYQILCDTFPNHCSSIFDDKHQKYDWGTFINHHDYLDKESLEDFLKMMTFAVYIDDSLKQSFALDYYYKLYWNDPEGGHTLAGSLVHKSKYYPSGTHEHTKQVSRLIEYMHRFVTLHPLYAKADYIVGTPYFGEKDFDLPTYMARELSSSLNITNLGESVYKIRDTKKMKSLETLEEKKANIEGAFAIAHEVDLVNKTIIVIDDVYRSGATMLELAKEFINRGASMFGLVATKTIRD